MHQNIISICSEKTKKRLKRDYIISIILILIGLAAGFYYKTAFIIGASMSGSLISTYLKSRECKKYFVKIEGEKLMIRTTRNTYDEIPLNTVSRLEYFPNMLEVYFKNGEFKRFIIKDFDEEQKIQIGNLINNLYI